MSRRRESRSSSSTRSSLLSRCAAAYCFASFAALTPPTAEAVNHNLRQRVAALHRNSEGQSSLVASGLSESSHAHSEGRVFPSWLAEQISSLDGNSTNSSAASASASATAGSGSGTQDAANIVSFSPPSTFPVPKHRPRDESIFSRPLFPRREVFPELPPITTTPVVNTETEAAAATTTPPRGGEVVSPLLPQDAVTTQTLDSSAASAPGSATTKVLNQATATPALPDNAAKTTQAAGSSEFGSPSSTPEPKGSAAGLRPPTSSLLSIAESNATTEQDAVAVTTEGAATDPSATTTPEQELTTELATTAPEAASTAEPVGSAAVQTTEGMVVPDMVKPSELHGGGDVVAQTRPANQAATIAAVPASSALAAAHFIIPQSDHTQVVHPVFVASKGNVDDSEELEAKLQQLQSNLEALRAMKDSARSQVEDFKQLEQRLESSCAAELDKRFAAMREQRLLTPCDGVAPPRSSNDNDDDDDDDDAGEDDDDRDDADDDTGASRSNRSPNSSAEDGAAVAAALFGGGDGGDGGDDNDLREQLEQCRSSMAKAEKRAQALDSEDERRLAATRQKEQNTQSMAVLRATSSGLQTSLQHCQHDVQTTQSSLNECRGERAAALQNVARIGVQATQLQQQAQAQAQECQATNGNLVSQLQSCGAALQDCGAARTLLQSQLHHLHTGQAGEQGALTEEIDRLVADTATVEARLRTLTDHRDRAVTTAREVANIASRLQEFLKVALEQRNELAQQAKLHAAENAQLKVELRAAVESSSTCQRLSAQVDGLTNAQMRAQLDALSAEDAAVRYSQYSATPLIKQLLGHGAEDTLNVHETNATLAAGVRTGPQLVSAARAAHARPEDVLSALDSTMGGFGGNGGGGEESLL